MYLKVFILLLIQRLSNSLSYKNYKAYTINFDNRKQFNFLNWEENTKVILISSQSKFPGRTEVVVAPEFQGDFEDILNLHGINYKLTSDDIDRFISAEKRAESIYVSKGEVSFEKYLRYSEIQGYLNQLAEDNCDIVTLKNYGLSYEKRNLTLLYISRYNKINKPVILVDSGFHGMEWIGPAQALYIINQLLENPKNYYLTERVDWIVIPLVNPDGYEYSHTTNRFWRRTRSKGKICDGVDANRNFNFHWRGPGASRLECALFYAGHHPFSEPETFALSNIIIAYMKKIKLYLTIHSSAQSILYPWGYTAYPPFNERQLSDLAENVGRTIFAVNGTVYEIGSSYNTLQPAAGCSQDWVYGFAEINLSYTAELPSGSRFWFDMPPEKILSVVEEFFEGIKVFHRYVEEYFG